MYAILYAVDGEDRLLVDGRGPDAVDGAVEAASEVDVDPGDVFAFLSEASLDGTTGPTVETVTNAFDPWLAWYGGTEDGSHVVLYGPRGADDRTVSFEERDGEYAVRLTFGTVESVPDRTFEPNDGEPVVVETSSRLYARRVFHDFCDHT